MLSLNVSHSLLGRPWIYDLDVVHYGRSNMNVFKYDNEKIMLNSSRPSEPQGGGKVRTQV